MTLEPGEYVFKCECDDGSVEVIMADEPCPTCNGEGFVDVLIAEGENETVRKPCHDCDGLGAPMVWMICQDCHGTAEIFVDDEEAAELIAEGRTPLRTPST